MIQARPHSDKPDAIETVVRSATTIHQGLNNLGSGRGNVWPILFLESVVKYVRELARLVESNQAGRD